MQYTNKKYILLSTIIFTVLLAWCNFRPNSSSIEQNTWTQMVSWEITNTQNNVSGDNWLDEGVTYLTLYTWNTIIITNNISGVIVTQTTDILNYKNEVYGFKLVLTQKAKGVKIKDWSFVQSGSDGTPINSHYISLYWDAKELLWDNYYDSHSISHKYGTYQRTIDIQMMSYKEYNSIVDFNGMPWVWRKPLEDNTLWHNNKYYFVLSAGNAGHDSLAKLIPSLTCKDIIVQTTKEKDCGNWINQLMTWFQTFNIK